MGDAALADREAALTLVAQMQNQAQGGPRPSRPAHNPVAPSASQLAAVSLTNSGQAAPQEADPTASTGGAEECCGDLQAPHSAPLQLSQSTPTSGRSLLR